MLQLNTFGFFSLLLNPFDCMKNIWLLIVKLVIPFQLKPAHCIYFDNKFEMLVELTMIEWLILMAPQPI